MTHPLNIIRSTRELLYHVGLVLRHKCLHDDPANEVGNGTDAEDHHVGSRLTVEAEESKGDTLLCCPVEELTRAEVDAHRTDTTSHRAKTDDGANG